MSIYRELAHDLMASIERKSAVPPKDKVSAAVHGEMAVLRLLIRENRQISAGEISSMLNMTTSRIAAVLNSLQKKGLIARSSDMTDKRRVMVSMTESGEAFCEARREEAKTYLIRILEKLGEHDAGEFVRLMKRMGDIIQEVVPPQCVESEGKTDDE